jgi:hypothetical protein
MSTSPYAGRIAFDDSLFGEDYPHAAHTARAYIAENLEHLADEAGQVRVAWRSPAPTTAFLTHETITRIDTPYLIWESDPFPVTLDEDGVPYPLRIDAAGFASQANAVTFRVVAAPAGRSLTYARSPTFPQVVDCTTSSTTDGWLTHADNLVQMSSSDAVEGLEEIPTIDAIGGDPVTVAATLATISVWALTSNLSTALRLTGVYAAEYVGT